MRTTLLCLLVPIVLLTSCYKTIIDNETLIAGRWTVDNIISQSGPSGPKDTAIYAVAPASLNLPKPYIDFLENGNLYILEEFPILSGSNWYTYKDTTTYQINGGYLITKDVLTGVFLTNSDTLIIQSLSSNNLTLYINQPSEGGNSSMQKQYWYNLSK
jgi:hypothetical protein